MRLQKMELINNFIKMFFIYYLTYVVYIKIIDYKEEGISKSLLLLVECIVIATIYSFFINYINSVNIIIITYIIHAIFISCILKEKLNFSMITTLVAFIITYIIYLISVIIAAFLLRIFVPNIQLNSIVSFWVIGSITMVIIYMFFRIKRLKNGFNFLKSIKVNDSFYNFIIMFAMISLLFFIFLQKDNNIVINTYLILATIITLFGLIIWIKSQITKTYKSKMRDRTIEIQKAEIDEQTKILEELKAENLKLASAVHKYNKKFSALEFAMKNALKIETNNEFANEISVIFEETKDASKSFAKETEVNANKLELTNIIGIDNMFKYMKEEARKKYINFDLKLNSSINPLIENTISKDKFETLIGDHLKDAIIAVNASDESYKSILVTLGLADGTYELSINDTGIEFEIETLLKLGQEQVTTHKEDGGSGIGFMTTFETLKECRASLIIEEYNPETTNYKKSVTIRFDGRNEYKIISYRAEEIKKQNKGRKIIVEKLK